MDRSRRVRRKYEENDVRRANWQRSEKNKNICIRRIIRFLRMQYDEEADTEGSWKPPAEDASTNNRDGVEHSDDEEDTDVDGGYPLQRDEEKGSDDQPTTIRKRSTTKVQPELASRKRKLDEVETEMMNALREKPYPHLSDYPSGCNSWPLGHNTAIPYSGRG